MLYLFGKLLEIFIHRIDGSKCVVSGISECSDMFPIVMLYSHCQEPRQELKKNLEV